MSRMESNHYTIFESSTLDVKKARTKKKQRRAKNKGKPSKTAKEKAYLAVTACNKMLQLRQREINELVEPALLLNFNEEINSLSEHITWQRLSLAARECLNVLKALENKLSKSQSVKEADDLIESKYLYDLYACIDEWRIRDDDDAEHRLIYFNGKRQNFAFPRIYHLESLKEQKFKQLKTKHGDRRQFFATQSDVTRDMSLLLKRQGYEQLKFDKKDKNLSDFMFFYNKKLQPDLCSVFRFNPMLTIRWDPAFD